MPVMADKASCVTLFRLIQTRRVITPVLHRTSTTVKMFPAYARSTVVPPMTAEQILKTNVKRFREAAGMSQEELAREAGVSVDAVRSWEQMKRDRKPDVDSIRKLVQVFGNSMDDYFKENAPVPAVVPRISISLRGPVAESFVAEAEAFLETLNRRMFASYRKRPVTPEIEPSAMPGRDQRRAVSEVNRATTDEQQEDDAAGQPPPPRRTPPSPGPRPKKSG